MRLDDCQTKTDQYLQNEDTGMNGKQKEAVECEQLATS